MKTYFIPIGLFCLCAQVSPVKAQSITEFPVCGFSAGCAIQITQGPDGNLWFTDADEWKIGRITVTGTITEFPVPSQSRPDGIVAGADGNLWFTENPDASSGTRVGKVTTNGSITEYPLPDATQSVEGIAWGTDGNLWVTEPADDRIARVTPAGTVTEFTIPTPSSSPQEITVGPDGNLWFTEEIGNQIGRITPAGAITEFLLPSPNSSPLGITAGPDGALWFTEFGFGSKTIGRISTAGVISEHLLNIQGSPRLIASGPDGDLWITEGLPYVARVTLTGAVTEFQLPQMAAEQATYGITRGPDGNIWFTASFFSPQFSFASFVGRLTLPTAASSIPALDWRGLTVLAALLAGLGFFALKRI